MDYELVGDYYLPCLKAPYSPAVGRFGKLRHRYLKENKRVLYYQLLTSDKLGYHLEEIDNSATDMFDLLVKQMAEKDGVTEKLKADNQMKWVGLMNNIRSAAEEIVLNDLIYA
ncbi:MAG TPA: TnpV protein [Eubacteriales bacterium]|nr:TnpV protein [Eubacteriales bacterium]